MDDVAAVGGEGPGPLVPVRRGVDAGVQGPPAAGPPARDLDRQSDGVARVAVQAAIRQPPPGEPVLQDAEDGPVVVDPGAAGAADQPLGEGITSASAVMGPLCPGVVSVTPRRLCN
ncbi:putative Peptidase dimerization [Streptomyces viridochromogenes Tue57]|uniref:Putative Peptidase dimerization n=1 Tax=Streptomyces viridochromogenes Tue57 TaxID=1160705 RepID=L8NZE8_STRVR|nr:putative Peptidase dimerization [Streptomyces viridochromogenes Tue57]